MTVDPGNDWTKAPSLRMIEFIEEFRDEAHFSAQQPRPRPPSWLSLAHGNAGWPQRDPRPPCARSQEAVGLIDQTDSAAGTGALAPEPLPERLSVETLRRRSDYLSANKGVRVSRPGFVLLVAQDAAPESAGVRIGFTVTKKIGGAVVRNRLKRRLRALAREILPEHGIAGADHVLIGRDDGLDLPFATLRSDLLFALKRVRDGKADSRPFRPRAKGRPRGSKPKPVAP